jgi:signal transduction histidine kinase
VVAGPEHVFELANETFCRLANQRYFVGRRLVDVYPQFAPATYVLDQIYESGESWSTKEQPVQLDKSGRGEVETEYFDLRVDPLRDEDGSIRGLIGAAVDVTEHVLARRARDDFLSVASHELKTPLTTLKLQIELVTRAVSQLAGATQSLLQPKMDMFKRQFDRLERLVNELLDISRLRSGTLNLTIERLDLVSLTKEILERLTSQLLAAGCTPTLRAQGPVIGHWDRMRLEQVMSNLLSNAMKYGAGRPVEVVVEADDGVARLHVIDQGIGIAPEHQARIFDRFERAAPARSFGGLGLGLWIVSRVVRALGGTVRVRSAPGAGSEFIVELPCSADRQ